MVERLGIEDLARGIKSLCNIGQKRKKHIFTCVPANEAMVAAGLARLEGRHTVERWGLRTCMWGKEVSATLVRKEMKKEEKHIFTYMPVNEAMVAVGLVRLEGQGMVEGWGFEDPAHEVKSLYNIGQKRDKKRKKRKKHNLCACEWGNGSGRCGG